MTRGRARWIGAALSVATAALATAGAAPRLDAAASAAVGGENGFASPDPFHHEEAA